MALEGFLVARALAGRAGSASSARATLSILGAEVPQMGPIPGAEVHVELCYYPEGSGVARYDLALYDTAVYADPSPPCLDVSCDVQSVAIVSGRDRPLDRFRTGTCELEMYDPAGKYSPWRTAAAPSMYGTIRPGIDVRVWVDIDGTVYDRFAGRVRAIVDVFPDTEGAHAVRFSCIDYLGLLGAYDGIEQTAIGAGETSGARLTRIADNAGIPVARAFDPGTVPLQATTLARNALDESGIVCDTEMGALFCDPGGTLVHRDRTAMVSDPLFTTVQATFGEIEPELCYAAIELASDTDKIENVVSIGNVGGSAATVDDDLSISLYGAQTHRRTDLIHVNGAESTVIANRHLAFYAYAANRIDKLAPVVTLDTLPDLLPLYLLHRIEVRRRAEGFQVVAELQIQAMREVITAKDWTLEFSTFSADAVFDAGRYDVGVYDTAVYAY